MTDADSPAARARTAQALLAPRAVALVGASGDATKNTARPQRYLRRHGFGGRVFPINPTRSELFGERAWPDIASVPEPIDHAFVMVPGDGVEAVVRECAARGIPLVTIYSDGFAEKGADGAARQQRIVDIARAGGTRVLGPNSIGTIVPRHGVALSVNAVLDMPRLTNGRLALVSQSGSLIGAFLSRGEARGIGFSALVSIGNEGDLSVGEVCDVLVDDEYTDAILLFLETLRDAPGLAHACRRAAAAGKPVVAYVLGQSALGRELAATHTGALAGSAEALAAWLDAQGVARVDQFETLLEVAPLLRQARPPGARRVAVVTTTGGGAAMVVDRIGSDDVQVVGPPPGLVADLAARGIRIGAGPVTDLTLAGTRREIYSAVLDAYLASDHCDTVLAVAGSSAQFHPEHAVDPIATADRRGKRLLAFAAPAADAALDLLARAGIPAFRTPEACADALRAVARWREPAARPAVDDAEEAAVAAASARLACTERTTLDEAEARTVFAALGIAQGHWKVLASADEPGPLPLPAAVKVLSPDILHKSDIGGVCLDCATEAIARDAARKVVAAAGSAVPAARIRGVLMQRMERGLADVIVGFRHDQQVGPTVVVGAGGTLAEIYRDVCVRPAPVSFDEAVEMVSSVRGLAPLRGYRGAPLGDTGALAGAVRRFSLLALVSSVTVVEAEVNPLVVLADGVVALDAVLVITPKGRS